MSSPYIGEIRMFGGNFAPAGWAFCNGALIPISENDTLFNLIGTTYGGDGQETFALPDMQGRIPVHQGQGPGITQNYQIGEQGGVEEVTLTTQQIPVHSHPLLASANNANNANPGGNYLAQTPSLSLYYADVPDTPLHASAIVSVGGSQPHTNLMPYLCVSFIISLFGIFPTQN